MPAFTRLKIYCENLKYKPGFIKYLITPNQINSLKCKESHQLYLFYFSIDSKFEASSKILSCQYAKFDCLKRTAIPTLAVMIRG